MDNFYATSGVSAIVVSVLLQVLKNTPFFPYLSRNTAKLNSAVSIVAAFVVSIGIIYQFDYDDATGAFILNVHGNLWDVLHTIEHTIGQWAAQQVAYKGLIVPAETLGEIRHLLARVLEPPPVSEGEAKAHTDQDHGTKRSDFKLFPDKPAGSNRPF